MARNSGTRTLCCPICDERYRRTNFMKRKPVTCPEARQVTVRGETFWLGDTHMIACYRKHFPEPTT